MIEQLQKRGLVLQLMRRSGTVESVFLMATLLIVVCRLGYVVEERSGQSLVRVIGVELLGRLAIFLQVKGAAAFHLHHLARACRGVLGLADHLLDRVK